MKIILTTALFFFSSLVFASESDITCNFRGSSNVKIHQVDEAGPNGWVNVEVTIEGVKYASQVTLQDLKDRTAFLPLWKDRIPLEDAYSGSLGQVYTKNQFVLIHNTGRVMLEENVGTIQRVSCE
jgi:hypothetical protein